MLYYAPAVNLLQIYVVFGSNSQVIMFSAFYNAVCTVCICTTLTALILFKNCRL